MLIDWLLAHGATVSVHDPEAMANVRDIYGDRIEYAENQWDAVNRADALAIVTEWPQYCGIDPGTLRWHMRGAVIFDGRNCLEMASLKHGNFKYFGIGCGERPFKKEHRDATPIGLWTDVADEFASPAEAVLTVG